MRVTDCFVHCFRRLIAGLALQKQVKILLFFLALLNSLQVKAQAELSSDSLQVETGNPLILQIRVPGAMGKPDSLNLEAWQYVLPAQNILSQSSWQTEGQFLVKRLKVIFFDADSIRLPALPILFSNGDTLFSNPLHLIVQATPSPEDLNDMAPIKDIHREPVHWTDYLPWILGVLAVLLLLGGLLWLSRRKPRHTLKSRILETPAHVLALKKLDVLVQKQFILKGAVKAHYAELTFIVREYLEKRYDIRALESTTAETLHYLKRRDFDPELAAQLQNLLEQSDLAKFAKIIPPEFFHAESLALARKIILQTMIETEGPPTTI